MQGRIQQYLGDFLLKKSFSEDEFKLLLEKISQIIGHNERSVYEHKNLNFTHYLNNDLFEIIICYKPMSMTLQLDCSARKVGADYQNKIEEIIQLVDYREIERKEIKRHSFDISKINIDLRIIYFVAVFTAVCSMLYELLLAQSLSSVMGNTVLRYNMTIGLYIASMGLGALFYNKLLNKDYFKNFIKVEILLSFAGVISPILVLVCDFLFRAYANKMQINFFSFGIQTPLSLINHFFIILIGFLSGFELPLLTDMGKSFDVKNVNKVLAFDYVGTLLGAVLFPIVILPSLSLFTIGYVVSFLNLLVAIFVLYRFKLKFPRLKKLLWIMIGLWSLIIIFSTNINNYIIEIFYLGTLK